MKNRLIYEIVIDKNASGDLSYFMNNDDFAMCDCEDSIDFSMRTVFNSDEDVFQKVRELKEIVGDASEEFKEYHNVDSSVIAYELEEVEENEYMDTGIIIEKLLGSKRDIRSVIMESLEE